MKDGYKNCCKECFNLRQRKTPTKPKAKEGFKICSSCKAEKPETLDYFKKDISAKSGFRTQCKDCEREYRKNNQSVKKKWYEENKEKIKEYHKIYRKNNLEKILKRSSEYYKNNTEKAKEKNEKWRREHKERTRILHKKYVELNREKIRLKGKGWRAENTERIKIIKREWAKKNKDKMRMYSKTKNSRKKGVLSTLTLIQWNEIKNRFDNRCAYCNEEKPLEQDHFIPLSKGGEYTTNNIVPACRSCNASKNNSDFFEWYPKQEFYSKEYERFILKHLGYKNNSQQLKLI